MNTPLPKNVTDFQFAGIALVLFGCAAAITTHLGVLIASGLDPVSSPIGALSQTEEADWFQYGLWLFALAQLILALLLNRPGVGRFTRGAQVFLVLNAALIYWLPQHYAAIPPLELEAAVSNAHGPMWMLGGSVGFAMTCVAGALWRSHRSTAFITLVCLLLWSLLAPIFLTIDPHWIGAYQRTVGVLLLFWTGMLAVRLSYIK